MNIAITSVGNGCLLEIKVIPNSKEFKLIGANFAGQLRLKCASPPVKGQANTEIENKLGEFFGTKTKVKIVRGKTNPNHVKMVHVPLPKLEVEKKLDALFTPSD